jgi:hypothetical protein
MLRFDSQQGQKTFLYYTAFKPTLGSTQPRIQWVLGALSPEVTRQDREGDHYLHLLPRIKMVALYLPSYVFMAWCLIN